MRALPPPTERQVQRDARRKRPLPSPQFINAIVRYDAETGKLFWKARSDLSGWLRRRWNAHRAGKEAFTSPTTHGYLAGSIGGSPLLAHRVAWACHYGEWPNGQVDHINHDKTDNRITNLRAVTQTENARNVPCIRSNKSGVTGVCRHKDRWQAGITVNGKFEYIGRYVSLEAAAVARKAREQELGFHPNHGRTK